MDDINNKKRIVMYQPKVPPYRFDFLRGLREKLGSGFIFYHSDSNFLGTSIAAEIKAIYLGRVIDLPFKLNWQLGVFRISIRSDDLLIVGGNIRHIALMLFLVYLKIFNRGKIGWWGHYSSGSVKPISTRLRLFLGLKLSHFFIFYTQQEVKRYQLQSRSKHPVYFMNNGLNIQTIGKFRAEYNVTKRGSNILFLGRLTKKSKLEDLIKAISLVHNNGLNLHVVGASDSMVLEYYQLLAENYKVSEKIFWHGPLWDEEDISRICNMCAIMVYPGDVGLSLIHALSYGIPVIVHNSKTTHMPEIEAFEEGINGISFTKENLKELTESIDLLLNATDLRVKMSAEAIKITSGVYNTRNMVNAVLSIAELNN